MAYRLVTRSSLCEGDPGHLDPFRSRQLCSLGVPQPMRGPARNPLLVTAAVDCLAVCAEALFSPHESLPWNPLMARVFYRRGIIESWGRGTIKMAELTASAGLPRPEIEDAGGCVTVRFRPSRYVPPQRVGRDVTERQRLILAQLADAPGGLPVRRIAAVLGASEAPWTIQEDLATLKSLGLVRHAGWGRGARWLLEGR